MPQLWDPSVGAGVNVSTVVADPIGRVEAIGNSLWEGAGLGVTGLGIDSRVPAQVAHSLGATEVQYGLSGGTLANDDLSVAGGYATVRQRMKRTRRAWNPAGGYGAESDFVIISPPTNDMIAVANIGSTMARAIHKNALRSIISHALLCSLIDAADPAETAFTFTGTWAIVNSPALPPIGIKGTGCDAGGLGYRYSVTQGDSFQIKLPGNYPGSARCPLSIEFVGYPVATGTATLTASGASTGTFDLTAANVTDITQVRKNGVVWRFAAANGAGYIAPGNGASQTLTITLTTITNAQRVCVDAVGIESDNTLGQTRVAVAGANNGGPLGSIWGVATGTVVANYYADAGAVVSEFGSNVKLVNIDAVLQGLPTPAVTFNVAGAHTASITTITLSAAVPASIVTANATAPVTIQIGGELIRVPTGGAAGSSFTGVTRGAWNTTAAAITDTTQGQRAVDVPAINYFQPGGVHWTEEGAGVVADALVTAFFPRTTLPPRRKRSSGLRAQCRIFNQGNQYTIGAGPTPIMFNSQWLDNAGMHGPKGALNHQVTIPADGEYEVIANLEFEWTDTAGGRHLILNRIPIDGSPVDGAGNQILQQTGASAGGMSGFANQIQSLTWVGDLRAGDILYVTAWQPGGTGSKYPSTTFTGAHDAVTTTLTVASTANMLAAMVLRTPNNEQILIGTVATGTSLTGCTRGTQNTTAQTHANGESIGSSVSLNGVNVGQRQQQQLYVVRRGPLAGSY